MFYSEQNYIGVFMKKEEVKINQEGKIEVISTEEVDDLAAIKKRNHTVNQVRYFQGVLDGYKSQLVAFNRYFKKQDDDMNIMPEI